MRFITLVIALLICTNAQAQIIRAEPFYVAPEAGVTNLLLDDYPGAAVAYSLRKLDNDYTGSAIRVRRSSDNTEQDIGFVNNYLDTAAMKTFVGANDGFVVTWYNQADSSGVFGVREATQETAAKQPQIISSGNINYQSSKIALDFNAGNSFLRRKLPSFTGYSHYVCANGNSLSGAGFIRFIGHDTDGAGLGIRPTLKYYDANGGIVNQSASNNSATLGTTAILSSINISNTSTIWLNGNQISQTTGTTTAEDDMFVGAGIDDISNGTKEIHEYIMYTSDKSSIRSSIESNINSFYSIY